MKLFQFREHGQVVDLNIDQICTIQIYEEYVTLRMTDGSRFDVHDRRGVEKHYGLMHGRSEPIRERPVSRAAVPRSRGGLPREKSPDHGEPGP